jgi:hypothetical protein
VKDKSSMPSYFPHPHYASLFLVEERIVQFDPNPHLPFD